MKGRSAIVVAMFVALTASASAHQSPPGCQGNGMTVDLTSDQPTAQPGQTVHFGVAIGNSLPAACDVSGLTVRLTLPARDGTPTGQVVTVASGVSLPAGAPSRLLGTVPYTVATDPGVTSFVVRADTDGVLHDAPVDHPAHASTTLGTIVTLPPPGTSGTVGATVPATLALTVGGPATFGAFRPGVAADYTATTTATVTSSAGEATLTAGEPGRLANGTFTLVSPLQIAVSRASWSAPTANEPVTVTFTQHIGASDPLRTGTYSTNVTLTLSTTTP